jgi:dTDP-4-amino-4,6-dideoxygalactose transaminase
VIVRGAPFRAHPALRSATVPLKRPPRRPRVTIPAWPGLGAEFFAPKKHLADLPYPLCSPGGIYFHRAGSAIYHLFRSLRLGPGAKVLVPDYHSGNEIGALREAGARLVFYRVDRRLQADLDQIDALSRDARVLFVIHYLGWPQPMRDIVALCEERGLFLIEDCALSFLSRLGTTPLGEFGDFSIFCLYKTLAVPNGGVLVQNSLMLEGVDTVARESGGASVVLGRTAELFLNRIRSRVDGFGRILDLAKRGAGRLIRRLPLRRAAVGDMRFAREDVEVRMSRLTWRLLPRFDYDEIVRRRRENYLRLGRRLQGRVLLLRGDLPSGVCPLFFPVLVPDKRATARALWRRGIEAVEFWNQGDPLGALAEGRDARYLRRHVLELPIHQDVSPAAVDHMAEQLLAVA